METIGMATAILIAFAMTIAGMLPGAEDHRSSGIPEPQPDQERCFEGVGEQCCVSARLAERFQASDRKGILIETSATRSSEGMIVWALIKNDSDLPLSLEPDRFLMSAISGEEGPRILRNKYRSLLKKREWPTGSLTATGISPAKGYVEAGVAWHAPRDTDSRTRRPRPLPGIPPKPKPAGPTRERSVSLPVRFKPIWYMLVATEIPPGGCAAGLVLFSRSREEAFHVSVPLGPEQAEFDFLIPTRTKHQSDVALR